MAEVSFRDVKKSYAGLQVVHGVSTEVKDGEFVVIVGPSGCGKSTLLRMVAGLEPITSGEIVIGGRVVNELEPKDRDIAMVFQNYALYPHMSVFDNMAYGLRIRGLALEQRIQAQDLRDVVDAALDLDLRRLAQLEPEAEVLLDRHVRVERVVLEHHGDVSVAGGHVGDDAVADHDLAGR